MTNPVTEPIDETADERGADDELIDEALDRVGVQGGRLVSFRPTSVMSRQ